MYSKKIYKKYKMMYNNYNNYNNVNKKIKCLYYNKMINKRK
jgi:hypothetical protein